MSLTTGLTGIVQSGASTLSQLSNIPSAASSAAGTSAGNSQDTTSDSSSDMTKAMSNLSALSSQASIANEQAAVQDGINNDITDTAEKQTSDNLSAGKAINF